MDDKKEIILNSRENEIISRIESRAGLEPRRDPKINHQQLSDLMIAIRKKKLCEHDLHMMGISVLSFTKIFARIAGFRSFIPTDLRLIKMPYSSLFMTELC